MDQDQNNAILQITIHDVERELLILKATEDCSSQKKRKISQLIEMLFTYKWERDVYAQSCDLVLFGNQGQSLLYKELAWIFAFAYFRGEFLPDGEDRTHSHYTCTDYLM